MCRSADWRSGSATTDMTCSEARTLGPDPGDRTLLELANSEDRILVTIDTDFGELIYLHDVPTRWTGPPARRAGGAAYRTGGRGDQSPSASIGRPCSNNDTRRENPDITSANVLNERSIESCRWNLGTK